MNKNKGYLEGVGNYRKFCITLPEDLEFFLDEMVKAIRKKKGARVSKSEVIRAALKYLKSLDVDLSGIQGETDIIERIKQAAKE